MSTGFKVGTIMCVLSVATVIAFHLTLWQCLVVGFAYGFIGYAAVMSWVSK